METEGSKGPNYKFIVSLVAVCLLLWLTWNRFLTVSKRASLQKARLILECAAKGNSLGADSHIIPVTEFNKLTEVFRAAGKDSTYQYRVIGVSMFAYPMIVGLTVRSNGKTRCLMMYFNNGVCQEVSDEKWPGCTEYTVDPGSRT